MILKSVLQDWDAPGFDRQMPRGVFPKAGQ